MRHLKALRNVRLGIKNLLLHKLRSVLTMLGVVFGVGSVMAMLAVGEGASAEALERIRKLGSHNIILNSSKPAEDTEMSSSGGSFVSVYGLTYADVERMEQTMPSIRRVVPAKVIQKSASSGSAKMDLRLVGTTPAWFELVERDIVVGRVLNAEDMEDFTNALVLTEHGVRKLLAGKHAIGSTIRVDDHIFEVVGVVRSESGGASSSFQTPDKAIDAYIPLNVARERFGDFLYQRTTGSRTAERVELHLAIVEVWDLAKVRPVAAAIERLLDHYHERKDYNKSVPANLLAAAEETKRQFNIVLGSIAGISLLVGGIGIMNIMLASVTERTREIGIRRAIGAKRRQIVGQFLIETVVLSSVGGAIGVGVGYVLPWLIERFGDMPTIVPGYAIALSVAISVGVGVIFGIYPAIRAAWLDPITALRHE
jgi:putative ABC transport system permease protein